MIETAVWKIHRESQRGQKSPHQRQSYFVRMNEMYLGLCLQQAKLLNSVVFTVYDNYFVIVITENYVEYLLFESPIWSGFLTPRGLDQDQDWFAFVKDCKIPHKTTQVQLRAVLGSFLQPCNQQRVLE